MPGVHARPTGGGHDAPPNFVFILADDLREDEMEVGFNRSLPGRRSALQTELIDQGATLPNFFVTTPLCCPSRVSFLTGQYAHNHGVYSNSALVSEPPGFGGLPRFYNDERDLTSLGAWLQAAGYHTALVGKYLNGYPNRQGLDQQGVTEDYVPRGWDEWYSTFLYDADFSYHSFRGNENGEIVRHDEHHLSDLEAHHAVDYIRRRADRGPFLLSINTYAPHAPSQPRPEDDEVHQRAGVVPPLPASCDEADLSDKPSHIRHEAALRDHPDCWSDFWSKRLDMTLATDDLIGAVVDELDRQGVLDNTYILFASDNGVLRGEHHIGGKSVPYEESVRVPLVVRGPGVPSGQTLDHLVANIDIAPTLLDLAGSSLPGTSPPVDGESLVPVLLDALPTGRWRDAVLLELASPIP
ncbi:MAG: sulfatase, partial [Acidimicrobiia bacterium]|nr:sulfatase [Acidimicrobiia bacterium]